MKPELPILKKQTNWQNLYFYQKTVVLYQMTVVFCRVAMMIWLGSTSRTLRWRRPAWPIWSGRSIVPSR